MLIHSVTPAELLMEQPQEQAPTWKQTDFGYLCGNETEQGFCINRVVSTDLSVYLKKELSPGSYYSK